MITDDEVSEIELLASKRSVLHWPALLKLIERMRKAEAALAAQAAPVPAQAADNLKIAQRMIANQIYFPATPSYGTARWLAQALDEAEARGRIAAQAAPVSHRRFVITDPMHVPIEPTEKMLRAGVAHAPLFAGMPRTLSSEEVRRIWQEMLAVSPEAHVLSHSPTVVDTSTGDVLSVEVTRGKFHYEVVTDPPDAQGPKIILDDDPYHPPKGFKTWTE
jgi:hypothetical protein